MLTRRRVVYAHMTGKGYGVFFPRTLAFISILQKYKNVELFNFLD